jgi:hypothetical protein
MTYQVKQLLAELSFQDLALTVARWDFTIDHSHRCLVVYMDESLPIEHIENVQQKSLAITLCIYWVINRAK